MTNGTLLAAVMTSLLFAAPAAAQIDLSGSVQATSTSTVFPTAGERS